MRRLTLTRIVPNLYLLPGLNEGRFPFAHSILVTGEIPTLIDAGCGLERLHWLQREQPPQQVIVSHSHPDHAAGCWLFAGLPIYVPAQTADTFGRLDLLGARFTEPGPLAEEWRQYVERQMNFRPVRPTATYSDSHIFRLGNITLLAFHTPGHTADHTCLWELNHDILLSFDIDLSNFGPWYGHRESSIQEFKASIRRLMALNPKAIVSSHKGLITDDIQARLQRFLDVFDARDRILLDLLRRPRTLEEIVSLSPFYGGYPYAPRLMRYWEKQMIAKHLLELVEAGKIVQEEGKFWVRRR